MMTLKEFFLHSKKEDIYNFLKRISKNKIVKYTSITREEIYNKVLAIYKENPEVILSICSVEEVELLKKLLIDDLNESYSYVDFTVLNNLMKNFLVLKEEKYYIPSDLVNYIKMAINLFDFKEYSIKDIKVSVLLGISRIYNVIDLEDLLPLLERCYVYENKNGLKNYIKNNLRLNEKISIVKYKEREYLISLENKCYKDVLELRTLPIKHYIYTLEEIISVGKYKINLFNETLFKYLHFLELHLVTPYIETFLDDLIIYCGFGLNDLDVLKKICGNVMELYENALEIIKYFPVWIYNGNSLEQYEKNIILPNKNDLCICGSGKKFKHCCKKKFQKLNN